ncbi:MAG: hypothetical protein KAR54_02885 [Candidatus Pacebacteria bacterium]|nr:hypothetical protein [Candidatus Paceibacterota bacterium]
MTFFSKTENKKILFLMILLGCFLPLCFSSAYEIRDTDTEVRDDFVLEPAKLEAFLDPGAFDTKIISILNRTDKTLDFKIELEDFSGSMDPNRTVILSGDERGPYSLKDYLHPEVDSFTLKSGQKINFTVDIDIPLDAEPGGLYGSVLVLSESNDFEQGGNTTIVSRLGALFFINVNGEVTRSGKLTSFKKIDSPEKGTTFELLFVNDGSTHLNLSGHIQIFNSLGTQIDEIEIPTYFAMPNSVRFRELHWNVSKLFGRYKAVVVVDRGYGGLTDELSLIFWAISVKLVAIILGVLILIILLIIWLSKTFDFTITREPPSTEVSADANAMADKMAVNKKSVDDNQSQIQSQPIIQSQSPPQTQIPNETSISEIQIPGSDNQGLNDLK